MLIALIALTSCSSIFRNHGYIPTTSELADVLVGHDTKDTVTSSIGPPSASGILDESAWYYVQSRFRHYGFQAPKEIERQVVAISFDARGVVRNIEHFGLEDGRVVTLSRRVTKSTVRDTTFMRQLLGNLGRFDASRLFGG